MNSGERILILAPIGRDAVLLRSVILKAGFESICCDSPKEFLGAADTRGDVVLLTEEAITPEIAAGLARLTDEQPAWSDFPILLITSDARLRGSPTAHLTTVAGMRGNVTLLERPIRIDTLLSTVRTAIRSRRRQYEIRDYLAERRRSEELLRETQKLESIGVLAGGIAHDFNNLLTGIIGNTSLCIEMSEGNQEQLAVLDEVMRAGKRAADLTSQLLAYAGKGRFFVKPINLSVLASEIVPLVNAFIPRATALRMSLAEDLPMIEGDNSQIQQVVMNLVINAAEALPEGGTGDIFVATGVHNLEGGDWDRNFIGPVPSGSFCFVEVRDTGSGMSQEVRSKIFDPFYTTKFQGRGLGLAAVVGIVRSHRGALRVVSEPGLGSTFTAFFPIADVAAAQENMEDDFALDALHGTILFVDDEAQVRHMAKNVLARRGMNVLLSSDGEEAFRVFTEKHAKIDLVILDLTMPVWGGEFTYAKIREVNVHVPVILSSGYSEAVLQERFADKGFAGLLQKPYTTRELIKKIRSVLVKL